MLWPSNIRMMEGDIDAISVWESDFNHRRILWDRACGGRAVCRCGLYGLGGLAHCEESVEKRQGGGEIRSLQMDVCNEDSTRRAVEQAVSEGGLGIVLNCAGMGIAGPAEDTFEEAVRAQFEVNYFGTLRVNRMVLPYFRAQGKLVLVMSSVAGRVPIPYQSHYSSSKYALDAYVEALRMEARPFGIRAALIEPGDTKTGFTAARRMAMPEDSPYRKACEGAIARMAHDEETGVPAAKPRRRLSAWRSGKIRQYV